ncbi:MAG: response regulator [Rhodobacteraceae bacterium]|nr:response regulator [Paracoccaceae bacterium]
MPHSTHALPTHALHILVADDHYANRLLIETLLVHHGHKVCLVENGQQAVDACHERVFDLIILDLQMPVLDGFGALKAIMSTESPNKNCRIFALTADTDYLKMTKMLETGFDAVLPKPFHIKDMIHHLDPKNTVNHTALATTDLHTSLQHMYAEVLSQKLLEYETLDILLRAMGPSRMYDVVKAYWIDARFMMRSLKKAPAHGRAIRTEKSLIKLRKIAYGLKGTSSNIGLLKISNIAGLLQNAPVENITFLLELLDNTLDESVGALAKYCKQAATPPSESNGAQKGKNQNGFERPGFMAS